MLKVFNKKNEYGKVQITMNLPIQVLVSAGLLLLLLLREVHLKMLINKTKWKNNALDNLKISIKSEISRKMKPLKEKEYYFDAAHLLNSRDFKTYFSESKKTFVIVPIDK